jgi:MFS transporter, NNP family, nitrate/nitrite transporter
MTAQLFQLVALPGLIGSLMRFPYTFAVPRFGGRNWTIVSASLLLIPTSLLAFFYPDRIKGWALGLNAAGSNIGVSTVQLLTPILVGFGWVSLYLAAPLGAKGLYLQNAGLICGCR